MPLDPRSAVWLSMLHRINAPRLHELPVEAARRSYYKLMFAYGGEPEGLAGGVSELFLNRRDYEGGPLSARLYRPVSGNAPIPVILWLHGGGWVLGDLGCYDNWCRALANATGAAVLALDYRLAPENRFPAAVDDSAFALTWLARHAEAFGIDASHISIAGDSAGGTLAAVACLRARDHGGPPVFRQILIYPALDMAGDYASQTTYGSGHFLEADSLQWFAHNYLDSEADRLDWRASPLRAPDHAGLPPALVINAECDPLVDQGILYVEKLCEAGNMVRHVHYPGMVHGFATMFKLFDETRQVLNDIADFIHVK
jgi:acetyl esterase